MQFCSELRGGWRFEDCTMSKNGNSCRAHRAYGDRCEGGTKALDPTSSYCFSRYVLETHDGQRDDGFPMFSSLRRGAALVPQPRLLQVLSPTYPLHSSASWEAPAVLHLFAYKLSMYFRRKLAGAGWPVVGSAILHLASWANGCASEDSTTCPTPLGREPSRGRR